MELVYRFFDSSQTGKEPAILNRDKIGWILVVLNLLMSLNSSFFFIGKMQAGIDGWLMMNSCAPSVFLFAAGFLLKSPVIMTAGSTMMFRYGTLGLFFFRWDGFNLIAQAGHIFMTLGVIYTIAYIVREKNWSVLLKGLMLGIAILIPYMIIQGIWFDAHPGLLEKLFSGNLDMPS